MSGNSCPEEKRFLKDGKECVASCDPYQFDIVDGNYVCTSLENTTQSESEESTPQCENFLAGKVCASMCSSGQYYYVNANGNKVCTNTCPTDTGEFRVVNYSSVINGAPQCVRDCGRDYEENGTCVKHCSSGYYQISQIIVGEEAISVKECVLQKNRTHFIREPLAIRYLPGGCLEAGKNYTYVNDDTGECVQKCSGTHPLLDETGALCVTSCGTYHKREEVYQCVARCPAGSVRL